MSMIPVNRKFLRGDIYYANLEPHLGSEQGGIRPVVEMCIRDSSTLMQKAVNDQPIQPGEGILHGMARFLALYQGEYSRERLILRLRTVHPKTITRLAQNDTGNVAEMCIRDRNTTVFSNAEQRCT